MDIDILGKKTINSVYILPYFRPSLTHYTENVLYSLQYTFICIALFTISFQSSKAALQKMHVYCNQRCVKVRDVRNVQIQITQLANYVLI